MSTTSSTADANAISELALAVAAYRTAELALLRAQIGLERALLRHGVSPPAVAGPRRAPSESDTQI